MGLKRVTRGDVIAALNGLVGAGVIASYKTRLFDKGEAGTEPDVAITVTDPNEAGPALQRVRDALEPLGMDLSVVLDLRDAP